MKLFNKIFFLAVGLIVFFGGFKANSASETFKIFKSNKTSKNAKSTKKSKKSKKSKISEEYEHENEDENFESSEVVSPRHIVFFHPDGLSLAHWTAMRYLTQGPDGKTAWDKLSHVSLYRGHIQDSITATSHSAATTHAYGIKVVSDSFGKNGKKTIVAESGFKGSILMEAKEKGFAVGLCQSGVINEPGTAVFASSVDRRENFYEVAKKVIESGVEVLLGGGEAYLLPKGVKGRFGYGKRKDGINLIKQAQSQGYKVVYTKKELMRLSNSTKKVLGVFALGYTFNDGTEEELRKSKKPLYKTSAPTIADMAEKTILLLKDKSKKGFFIVCEEDGGDNFSNKVNAKGAFEATKRSDRAIKKIKELFKSQKLSHSLLLVASDSNAGAPSIFGLSKGEMKKFFGSTSRTPRNDPVGGVYDGIDGSQTPFFKTKKDKKGIKHKFVVTWGSYKDSSGGLVAKADGFCANRLKPEIDNTEIYSFLHYALFKGALCH